MKSAIVIAKLLDCEGFTDYTANQIENYFRHRGGLTDRQKRLIERLERAIAEWCKDLPEEKRLLLGKFVGLHKKMAFDTGLRMGLTCMAVRNNQEYERHGGPTGDRADLEPSAGDLLPTPADALAAMKHGTEPPGP